MFGDSLNDVLVPTSHNGFSGRSFWNRRNRKDETPVSTEVETSSSVSVIPETPLVASAQVSAPEPEQRAPSVDGADRILRAAREDLGRGDLSKALHGYSHLIRRGRLVDEILPDLARLVREHPREPDAWQTLGDALTRAGRLDHANQSYEQGRKLRQ
jgi:hypothetical protein